MFEQLSKLIALANGDPVTLLKTADAANGGHVEEYFKQSQQKFEEARDKMARDGFLDLSKQVNYNGTAIRVVIEILEHLVGDEDVAARLRQEWGESNDEPPELRDVIVGATKIAAAYESSTRPLRRLYLDALRGSYSPEIFTFGFGPEVLEILISARLVPSDIEVLRNLSRTPGKEVNFTSVDADIEAYERLATGSFITMQQKNRLPKSETKMFVCSRADATGHLVNARVTHRGKLLLKMIDAGRGKGPAPS